MRYHWQSQIVRHICKCVQKAPPFWVTQKLHRGQIPPIPSILADILWWFICHCPIYIYIHVVSACPREHPAPSSTERSQSTPQGIFSCRGKDARLFDIGMSCWISATSFITGSGATKGSSPRLGHLGDLSTWAMASSSSVEATAGKVFAGDTEDAQEYKRWKTWVMNKLMTLESKVPENARGAYIYTLLGGKALDCIEHLEPSEYQIAGGEKVILGLLDRRFPQKDTSDEMSETLTAVFGLRANEGETLKVWISRAGELFDRCQRKCKVSFPEEARGWLILNRSGLNEEQKAVVLARSGGVLKQDEVGRSMRSCYPDYIVPKKRSFGAGLIEATDDAVAVDEESESVIQEVEALLADHDEQARDEPDEVFEESEVAEALAVTWKEKRKELGRLQHSRKFGPPLTCANPTELRSRSWRRKLDVISANKSATGHVSADLAEKGNQRVQVVAALSSLVILVQRLWNISLSILWQQCHWMMGFRSMTLCQFCDRNELLVPWCHRLHHLRIRHPCPKFCWWAPLVLGWSILAVVERL